MSDDVAFMKIYKTNERKKKLFDSLFFGFYGNIAPEVFDIRGNLSAYRDVKNVLVNREKVFEPIRNVNWYLIITNNVDLGKVVQVE